MIHTTIQRAKEGNHQAFQEMMEAWRPRIYQYVWKYFSGKALRGNIYDLSMEVTQKTFISAFKNIHRLKDTAKFKSWIYRIATNYCFEEERSQKKKKLSSLFGTGTSEEAPSLLDIAHAEEHPEELFHQMEISEILTYALAQLNPDQRTVVIMKEYEGLTFKEIAEALAISENTAKSRMYYGLNSLRKLFVKWNLTENMFSYGKENI